MKNFLQAGRGGAASRVNERWDLFMARGCGSAIRLALPAPDNKRIFFDEGREFL